MLQKMIWTKKFWNKPNSSQVFWLHRKERNNADKLLRLEDVKYQRILIMKNQIDVYRSKKKLDSSGNYFSSIKDQWCFVMFRYC
jgi:hypothetical protein